MHRILILDNYDSFTYNLLHYVEAVTDIPVDVIRNDKLHVDDVNAYDGIILSPGPGLPKQAGIMPSLLERHSTSKKILGICLGHQAIAEHFGATLYNLDHVFHGIATNVTVDTKNPIFKNLPATIEAGRYHSWAVDTHNLPPCLEIIARDENNIIMALQHVKYKVTGIQFHPESILTPNGKTIVENWIKA